MTTPIKSELWQNLAQQEASIFIHRIPPGPSDWRKGHLFAVKGRGNDCCHLCPNRFVGNLKYDSAVQQASMMDQETGGQTYTDLIEVVAAEFRSGVDKLRAKEKTRDAGDVEGETETEEAKKKKRRTFPHEQPNDVHGEMRERAGENWETATHIAVDAAGSPRFQQQATAATHTKTVAGSTAGGGVGAGVRERAHAGDGAKIKVESKVYPNWLLPTPQYPYTSDAGLKPLPKKIRRSDHSEPMRKWQLTPGLQDSQTQGIGPRNHNAGQQSQGQSIHNPLHPFPDGAKYRDGSGGGAAEPGGSPDTAQRIWGGPPAKCCEICDVKVHPKVRCEGSMSIAAVCTTTNDVQFAPPFSQLRLVI